jgi:hypothetical protein
MSVIPATWEVYIGGLQSRPATPKPQDLIKKITKAKKSWGCSLSGRHLTSKHETLSSKSSTLKTERKKTNTDVDSSSVWIYIGGLYILKEKVPLNS